MKLGNGLNCGDRVETTQEHDEGTGVHYEGIIDLIDPRDYNFVELLIDGSDETVNLHISYLQKHK